MKLLSNASLPAFVADSREAAERAVAAEIADLLRVKPDAVLGLATGNTPVGVYRELKCAFAAKDVSFSAARTFNIDEYLDLARNDARSFRRWMEAHLFAHVDLAHDRARLPDPTTPDPNREAELYEHAIHAAGGLDLLILGIGRNGHIGFNEPGSARESRTRVVELHEMTRADAAVSLGGIEYVPRRAISMGVATLLDARRIRVLAFGAHKSAIVKRTLSDPIGAEVPSTFLREHGDIRLLLDRDAAREVLAASSGTRRE